MCKKLMYLILFASLFAPAAAQAAQVQWIRAAYWDGRYGVGWTDQTLAALVRDTLQAAGYEILNADQLKTWMDARIADQKYSVVVFCKDVIPDTVLETMEATCTLRKYLDAGGKVVCYGDIVLYNRGNVDGSKASWGDYGAPAILGFNTAPSAARNKNVAVTLTPAGTAWGLTQTWLSNRPAVPTGIADLEILATDAAGNAAAWVKHYVAGDTFRGFVRIWDVDVSLTVRPTLEEFIRVAEYAGPAAANPNPADGATGVTLQLVQWSGATRAIAHQVYFGTDIAAVTAADSSSPEYRGQQSAVQVAYFYPLGLVTGMTYYWRIDEILDDESVSTGKVWSFTAAPERAWAPKPGDGAAYVAPDAVLEWKPSMTAGSHDVYLGTDRAAIEAGAPETKKAGKQGGTSYTPAGLENGTTYYWRVDEVGATGTTAGEIWSFTVRSVIAKTDPNMIGWWKMEDEKNGMAVDYSGFEHHGTFVGNPQYVEGYNGDALSFDGDDYVDCGTDATFNASTSITLAAWIKIGRSMPDSKVGSNQNGSTGGFKLAIYNDKPEFEIRTSANTAVLNRPAVGGTLLTPGVWYHVAGVYSIGQYLRTYVNGKLDRERLIPDVLGASNGTFKIGRESNSNNYWWLGLMDDVRLYNRALTEAEIAELAKGDTLVASNPQPAREATVDIRSATELSWSPGATAATHDVYFGKDEAAVKAAGTSSPEYVGRQAETTCSVEGRVELGGGDYFWRVDEVEADGTTIHPGNIFRFTVPGYLIIDNFESYTNDSPNRAFQAWVDGYGFSADEFFPQGDPGNGTGAGVGHDIWTEGGPYYQKTIMERSFLHSGVQSVPLYYDNATAEKKYYSEARRTWTQPQDLTAGGMTALSLWFRGKESRFLQAPDGSITATSTSGDISSTASDYFRFICKRLDGDGSIIVKVNSLTVTHPWAKAGVMIRETLDVTSTRAHMITTPIGRVAFENRPTTGAASVSVYTAVGAVPLPVWLKLERKGNEFTGYYSKDGVTWTQTTNANGGGGASPNPQTIAMTGTVYIGLAVTSNNTVTTVTAQMSDLTATGGVSGDWTVVDIGTQAQLNPANDADGLYVAVQDKSGKVAVATWPDATVVPDWTQWKIPLTEFAGVNTSAVTKIFIGVGNRDNPQADGTGRLFIDDVEVIK